MNHEGYDSNGVWLCPIHGLRSDSDLDELLITILTPEGTSHDFRLVSLSDDFKRKLEAALPHSHLTSFDVSQLSLGIRCETEASFGNEPVRVVGLWALSFAISLGYDRISLSDCYLVKGGFQNSGIQSTGYEWAIQGRTTPNTLVVGEVPYFGFFARAVMHHSDRVTASVRRFYEAGKRANFSDAVIDYVITLDGLLNAYDAHKFAQRAVQLVPPELSQKPDLETQIRALYLLRSQLVHGNFPQADRVLRSSFDGDIRIASGFARTIATFVFQRVLREPKWLDRKAWHRRPPP
ncbi:MAG: hypothetical protein HUU55_21795 [Myxococcales bacterium]|nr:hypothetical protein [Myxococcales bacterium]